MTVLSLLLEASGLLGFTWWLLARYRDPHVSRVGLAAVFLSWSLGFLGLLLLPIDMARHAKSSHDQDDHDASQSATNDDLPSFLRVWEALYWATFGLSWLVLPLLVEFSQNGEFRFERRLASSLQRMVLHWTILLAVAVAVTIYLLFFGHFTGRGLVGLAMAGANTYGLVWLIILLGFGLVDIPRSLWTLRHPEHRLRSLYFYATQIYNERMEAVFLYQDVVQDVRSAYDRMLHAESASIILTSDMVEIKAGLSQVLALVDADGQSDQEAGKKAKAQPTEARKSSTAKMRSGSSPMLSTSTLRSPPPSYSEVVELHRRVKATHADLRGTEQAWHELCLRAEALQQHISTSGTALPPSGIYSTVDMPSQMRTFAAAACTQTQRLLLPPMWACAALITALWSLCILWGELTMGWSDKFSLVHLLSLLGLTEPSVLEVLVFSLLLFMVLCAYSSLFRMRSFGRFALRGHRNSSEIALLKTSIHQCRLQFALSYNFLLLVHAPELTEDTAFHRLWSHMQVISVLGRDFSVYAPVLMVVLMACTAGNVYARVMKSMIGMEQYESLVPGHAEHETLISKGEQLTRKGLDKLRREQAKAARQQQLQLDSEKETQWRGRGFKAPQDMATSLLASHDGDADAVA